MTIDKWRCIARVLMSWLAQLSSAGIGTCMRCSYVYMYILSRYMYTQTWWATHHILTACNSVLCTVHAAYIHMCIYIYSFLTMAKKSVGHQYGYQPNTSAQSVVAVTTITAWPKLDCYRLGQYYIIHHSVLNAPTEHNRQSRFIREHVSIIYCVAIYIFVCVIYHAHI